MKELFELREEKLADFFNLLAGERVVIAPVKRFNSVFFAEVKSFDEVFFPRVNTLYSPKTFFYLAREDLLEYEENAAGGAPALRAIEPKARKAVLFGVRPCDFHALRVNDANFSSFGVRDPYYFKRRENTLTAVFACSEAGPNCFCDSFGFDSVREGDGFDFFFFKASADSPASSPRYFIASDSAEGRGILGEALEKNIVVKAAQQAAPKKISCQRKLSAAAVARMNEFFDDAEWKKLAATCLSCGACTAVCPTCNCFDVHDEFRDGKIVRVRSQLSCFFPFFTRVAGGHSLRQSREGRLKQFAYHKLDYFDKQAGTPMCVGCGRCFATCLKKINVFDLVNKLGGKSSKNAVKEKRD